jgi:hypothetical protein
LVISRFTRLYRCRGYSRDHRPDCEQLVLALIVNQDGFPFSYELFDGNRADVSTVEAILRTVERKHAVFYFLDVRPQMAGVSSSSLAENGAAIMSFNMASSNICQ